MNKLSALFAVIAAFLLGILIFQNLVEEVDQELTFEDVNVVSDENVLGDLSGGYITLPAISANQASVSELVGTIAILENTDDGPKWSYNVRYRAAPEQTKTTLVDETLFKGIVSAEADFGGKFNISQGTLEAEELAEKTIKNQLIVGYADPSKIPFEEFSKMKLDVNKDYFFVQSVVVTDVTTRRFKKHSGGASIEGMAFGVNGNIYSERDALKSRKVVSFRPINIADMQTSEAGSSSKMNELAHKARIGSITVDEAETLLEHLNKKVKDLAPSVSNLARPPVEIESDQALRTIIDVKGIEPIKQSSSEVCWAATTAMMLAWRYGREFTEEEAILKIDADWITRVYQRRRPLPTTHKFDFLNQVGFNYSAPQSYLPRGVRELLENHGPIWFTIGEKFSRHATIVTGLQKNLQSNEYVITYIDPAEGTVEKEDYRSFMRRYEEPAFLANEAGQDAAMTEEDLDIQVVHW